MPRTRRSAVLLAVALSALALAGCAAESSAPVPTDTPAGAYPDVTPTADMSVEILDRQVWAEKVLPGEGTRRDGIVPGGRTLPAVTLGPETAAWEAQVACAADSEAVLVATVTVNDAPSTVEIPCAVGVEATPEVTTLTYPAEAVVTVTFASDVTAIYAVLQHQSA